MNKDAGKTTMLMAMIENIYETMNLRITETAFELHLRKIYPTRNILSMRETETVSRTRLFGRSEKNRWFC